MPRRNKPKEKRVEVVRPDKKKWLANFAVVGPAALSQLVFQGAMTWKWSIAIWVVFVGVLTWSFAKHVVPHLSLKRRISYIVPYFASWALLATWGTYKEYRAEHSLKDRLLAQRIAQIASLGVMYESEWLKDGSGTFPPFLANTYETAPGSLYPDPSLLNGTIDKLCAENLFRPSSVRRTSDDSALPLIDLFLLDASRTNQEANRALGQFQGQDTDMILLLEDLSNKSQNLIEILSDIKASPTLVALYSKGVPKQAAEFFRYYYLSIMNARRIVENKDVKN